MTGDMTQKEKGFTLIEVVAALVIFSIAILLFSNFFVKGYSLSKKQDNRMIALNLARQTAEEWKSEAGMVTSSTTVNGVTIEAGTPVTYDEIKKFKGQTITINAGAPLSINGRSYLQEVAISALDPDTAHQLLLLTITVRDANHPDDVLTVLHTGVPEKG
ncbi:prepilin-type N-terminal cleavage/methylation domain-containing protein [Aneurinibacillus soli]|uniref:Uncharacterized protein n=2 Tax=Aneurinibacillus soli TaxID=1500254 RepID=A0A0U5B5L7_9BACL|nr:prepilin-type N-terminal cleavage/methylation domain-containing protein [Aneurinibacillus soli]BAU26982.1 hypothetical protein CB4_01151 [Aneurinibacillus soli]